LPSARLVAACRRQQPAALAACATALRVARVARSLGIELRARGGLSPPPSARRRRQPDADRAGTLVVRLTGFGSPALVDHSAIVVAPLASSDTIVQPVVRREDASALPAPFECCSGPAATSSMRAHSATKRAPTPWSSSWR
jgi:hypothetical protein